MNFITQIDFYKAKPITPLFSLGVVDASQVCFWLLILRFTFTWHQALQRVYPTFSFVNIVLVNSFSFANAISSTGSAPVVSTGLSVSIGGTTSVFKRVHPFIIITSDVRAPWGNHTTVTKVPPAWLCTTHSSNSMIAISRVQHTHHLTCQHQEAWRTHQNDSLVSSAMEEFIHTIGWLTYSTYEHY